MALGISANDQLEADLAVTRERVAHGVDAIAERVSAAGIQRQIKASLERRGKGIVQLVRQHPLPFLTLLGLAVGLLIWKVREART
jgi:hypothetical protein